jgi:hypothetical protein
MTVAIVRICIGAFSQVKTNASRDECEMGPWLAWKITVHGPTSRIMRHRTSSLDQKAQLMLEVSKCRMEWKGYVEMVVSREAVLTTGSRTMVECPLHVEQIIL